MASRMLAPLIVTLALFATADAAGADYVDPLDAPAQKSALAPQRILNGAAMAGSRIVVVGQRGHILYSDDQGKTWKQASVPVSVDLVAVNFPTPQKGWAVGHSGVVLATSDGGVTWTKQLDGRTAARLMAERYGKAEPALADEAGRFVEDGPDKPLLDVWFDDERVGYVVGTFNLAFRTDDGGKHWVPWFDRTDNPKRYHLYAVRRVGEDLYVAGEAGIVLKLDPAAQRLRMVRTPYEGTYFGITGKPGNVVLFGLRGNAYRTSDGGASWQKIDTKVPVGLTGSTVTPDGRIVLVSQAGHVLASRDGGTTFAQVATETTVPAATVVAASENMLVIAGPHGVKSSPLH